MLKGNFTANFEASADPGILYVTIEAAFDRSRSQHHSPVYVAQFTLALEKDNANRILGRRTS
jgi:hypothetical protein